MVNQMDVRGGREGTYNLFLMDVVWRRIWSWFAAAHPKFKYIELLTVSYYVRVGNLMDLNHLINKNMKRRIIMADLRRANKVTAFWESEGMAKAVFYKTHERLETVCSDDPRVIGAGFVFDSGTDEEPKTANDKLVQFKDFIIANCTAFGITYDPIDRRADGYKFPNKYPDDKAFGACAADLLKLTIEGVLAQLNEKSVAKLIEAELLPIGTSVQYGIGEPVVEVSETYRNGNLKYATAKFGVAFAVSGKEGQVNSVVKVGMVSGQIKKPRTLGEKDDVVFTAAGIKGLLTDAGLLPKKPAKEEQESSADGETPESATAE